ncbi:MAG: ACT domain-containing protein [Syntrophomonadales bacterium]
MVEGPLDISLTGILASLAAPLSATGISIFAILPIIRIAV